MQVNLTPQRIKFLMEISKNAKKPIATIGRKMFKTNVATYAARDYLIAQELIIMDWLSAAREYAVITEKGLEALREAI